jgi:very-short-patch-repair endonuclease
MPNNNFTEHEDKLAEALARHGVVFERHYKDYFIAKDGSRRHKTVDFFIPKDNIFIEVDGMHHITRPETIISDFNRDYFSHKKNFFTKHITNEAIDMNVDQIAAAIATVAENAPNKMGENLHS